MALLPSAFFDAVVAIGFASGAGQPAWAATGFLYGRPLQPESNLYRVFLVTNRHVFEGHDAAFVRFNMLRGAPAREYQLSLRGRFGQRLWSPHPDPEVDIAVACPNVTKLRADGAEFSYFREDKEVADIAACESAGVTEGDPIFVLGFPMGDVGFERNFVIVRHGTIARVRDTLLRRSKDLILDTLAFPGNSGGPIVTRPEVVAAEIAGSPLGCELIGIVKSYTVYRNTMETERGTSAGEQHSGLAQAHPVDFIKGAIDVASDRVEGLPDPTCTHDTWPESRSHDSLR